MFSVLLKLIEDIEWALHLKKFDLGFENFHQQQPKGRKNGCKKNSGKENKNCIKKIRNNKKALAHQRTI